MAITAAAAAVTLITAYATSSPGSSRSLCPEGQSEFLLLMDPVPPHEEGSAIRISYDVCGLPEGTPYRARLRLSRREDFIKKMFGDQPKPLVVTFQDRVEGPASRRSRRLDLGSSKPGSYTLELSVLDNRGRERKRVQAVAVKPD